MDIMREQTATSVAGEDPLVAPRNMQERVTAKARPPGMWPTTVSAKRRSWEPAPPVHDVRRKDEEGDRHQCEPVDPGEHPLDGDPHRQVGEDDDRRRRGAGPHRPAGSEKKESRRTSRLFPIGLPVRRWLGPSGELPDEILAGRHTDQRETRWAGTNRRCTWERRPSSPRPVGRLSARTNLNE